MTIYDGLFPLGIGTNRFTVSNTDDREKIEQSAAVVTNALEAGASYVDIGFSYSKGFAPEICRLAFHCTKAPRHITVKSNFLLDKNSDGALRRVEDTFRLLEIDHAFCFVCWNIVSWEQFLLITQKGGLYDGAVKARELGLVDHICFSTHAPPTEIVRILESGLFEGVTISLSPLNSQSMRPVLECAHKRGIGVVAMNPLAGGLIPQNQEYFSFLRHSDQETTVQAALHFTYAHPAVKIVLSGMSSQQELEENLNTFRTPSLEPDDARLQRVEGHFAGMSGFCTGCRYCDGCPRGVNVYELMQSYNEQLLPSPKKLYGKSDPTFLRDASVCRQLKNTFGFLPETAENPCVNCGLCESKCTAHLPIRKRIAELYEMFAFRGFSSVAEQERLRSLIGGVRRVAFYPGGGYTASVLAQLKRAFPAEKFEISLFDSSPKIWGTKIGGIPVQSPKELLSVRPELVIVSNYNYGEEIFDSLTYLKEEGIRVVKLHEPQDVPWMF